MPSVNNHSNPTPQINQVSKPNMGKGVGSGDKLVTQGQPQPRRGFREFFSELTSKFLDMFKSLRERSVQQSNPGPARARDYVDVDLLTHHTNLIINSIVASTTIYHKYSETAFKDPDSFLEEVTKNLTLFAALPNAAEFLQGLPKETCKALADVFTLAAQKAKDPVEQNEYMTLFAALPNAAEFLPGLPQSRCQALADVFTLAAQKAKDPVEQKTFTKLANDSYAYAHGSTQPVSDIAHAAVKTIETMKQGGASGKSQLLDNLRALAVNPQAAEGIRSLSDTDRWKMFDALKLAKESLQNPANR
jgi:hypothetical protein